MVQARTPAASRNRNKIAECDQPGALHKRALELLAAECTKENGDALWLIAAKIKIPYHWLVALRRGAIKQPSVNRIQWMIEQLSGRKVRN